MPQTLEIPATLKHIPDYAFYYSSNITEFIFNEGLLSIGVGAFSYANITRAILPDSLTYLGSYAFYESEAEEVYIGKSLPFIETYAGRIIFPAFNSSSIR